MKEIEAGRIGEVICLLRLAKMGIQSEIVNLGTSDIISFAYDYTWRIQVKSSQIKRNGGNSDSPGYQFCVSKGLNPKKSLTEEDCDIVALVGIPQERVLFAPVSAFRDVKTKRLKAIDYLEPDVEWTSWSECMSHYGINPPRPSSLPIPDPLLTGLGDPHTSP